MTNHLSVRLAWHDAGWDGHICNNPKANVHCIGPRSYPGSKIGEERDLEWEEGVKGCHCQTLDKIPVLIVSMHLGRSLSVRTQDLRNSSTIVQKQRFSRCHLLLPAFGLTKKCIMMTLNFRKERPKHTITTND